MPTGTVKWFNAVKGFGFISPDNSDGKDVFVHRSIVEQAGLNELIEGQRVEFDTEAAPKGPQATSVRPA